jgi:hypothetical protein
MIKYSFCLGQESCQRPGKGHRVVTFLFETFTQWIRSIKDGLTAPGAQDTELMILCVRASFSLMRTLFENGYFDKMLKWFTQIDRTLSSEKALVKLNPEINDFGVANKGAVVLREEFLTFLDSLPTDESRDKLLIKLPLSKDDRVEIRCNNIECEWTEGKIVDISKNSDYSVSYQKRKRGMMTVSIESHVTVERIRLKSRKYNRHLQDLVISLIDKRSKKSISTGISKTEEAEEIDQFESP